MHSCKVSVRLESKGIIRRDSRAAPPIKTSWDGNIIGNTTTAAPLFCAAGSFLIALEGICVSPLLLVAALVAAAY